MTDLGNAERFQARWGSDVRYAQGIGWLLWNGKLWRADETGGIVRRAAACVRDILRESAACATAAANATDDVAKAKFAELAESLAGWARRSESRDRINAMLDLARAQKKIAIRVADLDTDLWVLNCRNGTIELRTGDLRPHRREDLITKLAPVDFDPAALCPKWHDFLNRIFADNQQLKEFAQRSLGYTLTGVVHDHILHVLFGTGANGKSTFIETVASMLGDYACAAAPKMLVSRKHDAHPTELADLRGARFVSAIETAEGGSFDEERVKALTGGDRIKARKMKKDFFEFYPTHKLFLATNYRPAVKGDDNGIWRRIRLWPFMVEIPRSEQDPRLKEKLLLELAGILTWCVRGCLAWQEDGLCEATEVIAATNDYREQQDRFGDWFAECCLTPNEGEPSDRYSCTAGMLYKSYRAYAQTNGFKSLGSWRFTERLQRRAGITRQPGRNVTYFGVRLTDDAFNAAQGYHGPTEEHSHDAN